MPRQAEGVLEWVDAPVRPGEFVVIVGDVLERFTNGTWRATPHRVLQTDAPRSSIIRFNAVAPQTVVQPLPHFVSDARPPLYSVRRGEGIASEPAAAAAAAAIAVAVAVAVLPLQ